MSTVESMIEKQIIGKGKDRKPGIVNMYNQPISEELPI